MTEVTLILQLFGVFFVIGLFTFGGGYAMLSFIQTQVVVAHGWLSESAFTDIVAISQMTPAPSGSTAPPMSAMRFCIRPERAISPAFWDPCRRLSP